MHDWAEIRQRVLSDELSKRAACRVYDLHWSTLTRVLDSPISPDYQQNAPRAKPKLGPFLAIIGRILDEDRTAPARQRHTAVRIFHRLRDEFGYAGGRSVVDAAVRVWRQRQAEVFVPLTHRPGEAQADFGLVRRPNEKGHVENLVGFARRNFLVPVPVVPDLEAINHHLFNRCVDDLIRTLRGKDATNAGRLEQERPALLRLPETPFPACRVESPRVSSLSLVRFDTNDYSVPVEYAHRRVTVRAGVDTVRIEFEGRTGAMHSRCWDRHQQIFDPIHYLRLLERKPGALDHALPLAAWPLPGCFVTLRARLVEMSE